MFNQNSRQLDDAMAQGKTLSQTFMANVFSWMFIALSITAVTAYLFGTNMSLRDILFNVEGGVTIMYWIVLIAPLALVFIMNRRFQRLSVGSMIGLFGAFSVLMGMSFGSIFMLYSMDSILMTFGITGLTFGSMAVLGYTTKTDLTKFGSILYMALIGVIIASVLNMFMGSGPLDFIISIAGVLIFTGLTAYDVQKIKRIGMGLEVNDGNTQKLVILGALSLYLDFINLFLFLLRFFGSRD